MRLEELIDKVQGWTYKEQFEFLNSIVFNVTIGIRSIWGNETLSADEKIESIKWLNEFNHRVQNLISESTNVDSKIDINKLVKESRFYASQNDQTKAEISAIFKIAYKRVDDKFKDRRKYNLDVSLFRLLEQKKFREKTGMYISESKISTLYGFILGYWTAIEYLEVEIFENEPTFEKFNEWIADYFGWKESTTGWKNIILAESENDERKALTEFFKLYDKFKNSEKPTPSNS